jgi:hypothetical protein
MDELDTLEWRRLEDDLTAGAAAAERGQRLPRCSGSSLRTARL